MFKAGQGGILWAGAFAFVVLRGCSMADTSAFTSGGAIFLSQYAVAALIDTSIARSSAVVSGGAVRLSRSAPPRANPLRTLPCAPSLRHHRRNRSVILSPNSAAPAPSFTAAPPRDAPPVPPRFSAHQVYAEKFGKVLGLSTRPGACSFSDSSVDLSAGRGGTFFLEVSAYLLLAGCTVTDTSAWQGGAVFTSQSFDLDSLLLGALPPLPADAVLGLGAAPDWANFAFPPALPNLGIDQDAQRYTVVHWCADGVKFEHRSELSADALPRLPLRCRPLTADS